MYYAPLRKISTRVNRPKWLTNEIIELLEDRDDAFNDAYETKKSRNIEARKLRTEAKRALRNARAEYIKNQQETTQRNSGQKSMSSNQKSKRKQPPQKST